MRANSDSPRDADQALQPSDEEAHTAKAANWSGAKRARNPALARAQREKELEEQRKEREKLHAEQEGRRRNREDRANKRQKPGQNLKPGCMTGFAAANIVLEPEPEEPIQSTQPQPDTPPPNPLPQPTSQHKKTARQPVRRGRLGRNQYSKDRPILVDAAANGSPSRSQSRVNKGKDSPQTLVIAQVRMPRRAIEWAKVEGRRTGRTVTRMERRL